MKKLEFNIEINAKAEDVWFVLWDDFHYRKWTAPFMEGSYAISDWKEGSTVHFLSPSGDGMYSIISTLVPNKKMVFTHKGVIKNFEEQPLDEETKAWTGAQENYTLSESNGTVSLNVIIDVTDNHLDYFNKTFPAALEIVKQQAENIFIAVETTVNAPVEKVWTYWTSPEHIKKWNSASNDWHTTKAENDLKSGGKFMSRMEAKDGSTGFDFEGIYTNVKPNELIEYEMSDGRKVKVEFSGEDGKTKVIESFDPEKVNSLDLQKNGWQAILDNFKKYSEE